MLRLLSDVRNHFAERIGALTGFPLAIPNYPKMAAGKEPALILAFSPKEKEIVVPASDEGERSEFALVCELNGRRLSTPNPPHGFWRAGKIPDAIRGV